MGFNMAGRKELLGDPERIVIKVGTSSITQGGTTTSDSFMDSVATQVKQLQDEGREVILVSSGAVRLGLLALQARPKPNEIPVKQAAASVGQGILMQRWNDSFQKVGVNVAQILITMDDYADRDTVLNLNNTIRTLLAYRAVPIFNENDAISTKEIGAVFGDNDTLSAVIASRMDADLLIILSDVAGLYDANPKLCPEAKLVPTVTDITADIVKMAGDPTTRVGVGGMKTKIKAAKICHDAGCRMIIASSAETQPIVRAVAGEDIGTIFLSDTIISKKRRWMKSVACHGVILVDEGAAKALATHQSLLPVGVLGALNAFLPGEVVELRCGNEVIAKGVPDYAAEDVRLIAGKRSEAAAKALGGKLPHKDVIRSENIALLP